MNSPIKWVGGKRLLAKKIIRRIPPHACYCEPFGGAAWVLFKKGRMRSSTGELAGEVYNDINGDLYNLFLQTKFHGKELVREAEGFFISRRLFTELKGYKPLTEIQRAARFLLLFNFSFGAMGGHYATGRKGGGAGKSKWAVIECLAKARERLDKVLVENLDFERCITQYDSPDTFFYCDPPYFHGVGYDKQGVVFTADDHARLRACLGRIKGKFLLSYDDCPEARRFYKEFKIERVARQKGINLKAGKTGSQSFRELLIRNF